MLDNNFVIRWIFPLCKENIFCTCVIVIASATTIMTAITTITKINMIGNIKTRI